MAMTKYPQWPVHVAVGSEVKQALSTLFETAKQLQQDNQDAPQWAPCVDVKEDVHQFVLYVDLPGVDRQSIQVQMDQGTLTIQGERIRPQPVESAMFTRMECSYGRFYRSFTLPDSADADAITAVAHQGVLEVKIPKRAAAVPRRIEVVRSTE